MTWRLACAACQTGRLHDMGIRRRDSIVVGDDVGGAEAHSGRLVHGALGSLFESAHRTFATGSDPRPWAGVSRCLDHLAMEAKSCRRHRPGLRGSCSFANAAAKALSLLASRASGKPMSKATTDAHFSPGSQHGRVAVSWHREDAYAFDARVVEPDYHDVSSGAFAGRIGPQGVRRDIRGRAWLRSQATCCV